MSGVVSHGRLAPDQLRSPLSRPLRVTSFAKFIIASLVRPHRSDFHDFDR
jgi:hypothetical protein